MDDYSKEALKKEQEREELDLILAAYAEAIGESFDDIESSETPDFFATDHEGHIVGIELTRLKLPPDQMWSRRLEGHEWADDGDALFRVLELSARKEQKLDKGGWPKCGRRILFLQLVDYPLSEFGDWFKTDTPTPGGFDEIWLADFTTVEMYGRVLLSALAHPEGNDLELPEVYLGKPYG